MKKIYKITEIHELISWLFISFVSSYIDMINFMRDAGKNISPNAVDCQTLFDTSMFISLLLEVGEEDAVKIIESECDYLKDDYKKPLKGFGNPVTEEEYKSFIEDFREFFIDMFVKELESTFSSTELNVDEYINDFSMRGSSVALIKSDSLYIDRETRDILEGSSDLDELSLRDMKDLTKSAYNIIKSIDNECVSIEIDTEDE